MSTKIQSSLPGEIWKDIAGYDGEYQVSSLGRVRSFKTIGLGKDVVCRVLTPNKTNSYLTVLLLKRGRRSRRLYIHRLVADAFLGPCPEGYEVSHKDENARNNELSNLCYASHKENVNMPGRRAKMEKYYNCK